MQEEREQLREQLRAAPAEGDPTATALSVAKASVPADVQGVGVPYAAACRRASMASVMTDTCTQDDSRAPS